MINIKSVEKAASLIRKELGIGISKLSKENLKDIKVPENVVTYDAIKVGRDANPTKHYTDVFIFRDKDGNIVSTVHNKIDNEKIKQTVRKFSPQKEDYLFIDNKEDYLELPINRQRIRGYEKENGKITKCFEENRAISEDKKQMESLRREVYPNSEETIKISHFENGIRPKYIENHYEKENLFKQYDVLPEAIRAQFERTSLKYPGKYTGYFILKDSKVSDEGLKEIAQHPYFLPYFSPDNKFIYRMSRQVEKEKRSLGKNTKVVPHSKKSHTRGYCNPGFGYTIGINRINPNGSARTRRSLVNTIGHEFGHADWEQKVFDYEMAQDGLISPKKITPEQIKEIEKYKKASENYVSFDTNMDEYTKNFAERKAREEGRNTLFQYENFNEMVEKDFPAIEPLFKPDIETETNDLAYSLFEMIKDAKYKNLPE